MFACHIDIFKKEWLLLQFGENNFFQAHSTAVELGEDRFSCSFENDAAETISCTILHRTGEVYFL